MNLGGTFRESFLQQSHRVIAHGDDRGRAPKQLRQRNREVARRKNVVRMRGKAVGSSEEFLDPIRCPRRHSGEVSVNMPQPFFLQAHADVDGLIEPQKIRLAAPVFRGIARDRRDSVCFQEPVDFRNQSLFLRQIMDALDQVPVPILFRFADRPADREYVDFRPLPVQLKHLAIAEGLAKRGEAFEQVGDLAHRRRLAARRRRCNPPSL